MITGFVTRVSGGVLLAVLALAGGRVHAQEKTTLGGYGDAVYSRDFQSKTSMIDLERFVLFVGHEFTKKISLVSELEMEDAKVSGGTDGGEIAFEQAYLRFDIDAGHSLVAGLFLPRIGILNEDHLPTSFNGNERNSVETYVIPSTWRELGVGFYGSNDILPVEYSLALVNGLNAAGFEHGSVIREGRFEGRNATANNLAVTGSLRSSPGSFRLQISGYYGGSAGMSPPSADSLGLRGGPFGTPVALGEADVQYTRGPVAIALLGTIISIPDAGRINAAFGNNTPKSAYGCYAEAAYDLLYASPATQGQRFVIFARYERLNLNAAIPPNAVPDGTLDQNHFITGVTYAPISTIVIKADIRFTHAGNAGPVNAVPAGAAPGATTVLTAGLGFSF